MKAALDYLVLYIALFATGYPFLFFCANFIWCRLRGTWTWDRKRRFLMLNALIYPVMFALFYFALIRLFRVGEELQRETNQMIALNQAAVREGADPQTHNYVLGAIFFAAMYYGAALVPATLVGLVYSITSTAMLLRTSAESDWRRPFLLSGLTCALFILLAFALRTPIFNAAAVLWK